jgi:hypothetical protein
MVSTSLGAFVNRWLGVQISQPAPENRLVFKRTRLDVASCRNSSPPANACLSRCIDAIREVADDTPERVYVAKNITVAS